MAGELTRDLLEAAHADYQHFRAEMISAQEDLDWDVYHGYGLSAPRPRTSSWRSVPRNR